MSANLPNAAYNSQTFRIRKQVFSLLAQKFRFFDANDRLLYFCEQKAFKLKEDIRVYADEAKTQELLWIQARQILDFSAAYDVYDSVRQEKVGVLRRKGLKSMLRDEWEILDPWDRPMGMIQEDSTALALIRRLLTNLVPQSFHVTLYNQEVAHLKQHFNPFVLSYTLDLNADTQGIFDRRLAVAASLLILAIEGRQS
ncbi:MAG: hypothetical protein K1Y36_14715 [Blastocatellia bacterium]|nr:hypothetical protein [Blastocatellia bacterium]